MTILGIDPGSSRIGFCVLEKNGGVHLIKSGVIDTGPRHPHEKISILAKRLATILRTHQPSVAAVEKLYFSKNKKTAVEVVESIGVIKYILISKRIPIQEYAPQEIKRAITGFGNADKTGVAKMSKLILNIREIPGPDDVGDAVAIALTAAYDRKRWG